MKRFVAVLVTFFAIAFGAVIAAPTAALAHDEIAATTPTADSSVAPGEIKVSVTFNEPVMNVGDSQGLEIQVTAPDGTATMLPCPTADGPTLWAAYEATDLGTYVVDWRSVSSDGHANSGTFNFEVADGAAAAEAPDAPMPCARTLGAGEGVGNGSEVTQTPMAVAETAETPAAEAASSGSKLDPMVGLGFGIGLFVVLSVLGALAAEMQKRRRAAKEADKKLKAEVEANPDLLRGL
jgi:methionine-rich copper-binding protein CopC